MFYMSTFEIISVTLSIIQLTLMAIMMASRHPRGLKGFFESLPKMVGCCSTIVGMIVVEETLEDQPHDEDDPNVERGLKEASGPAQSMRAQSSQSKRSVSSMELEKEPQLNDCSESYAEEIIYSEVSDEGSIASDASSYQSFN